MSEALEEHEWIETPTWRWCRKCGAYQKRFGPNAEWMPFAAAYCPGTPGWSPKVARALTEPRTTARHR